MGPALKSALLEAAEEVTKLALDQGVKISQAYAQDKPSGFSLALAQGAKLANDAFLQELADKINPADNV